MQTTSGPTARSVPHAADALRGVLAVNAATSTFGGAAALVAGGPVADLIGTDHVDRVRIAGAGLLLFALAVGVLARGPAAVRVRFAPTVSAVDIAWVVVTVVAVADGWFSTRGDVVMGVLGLVVLDLAVAQLWFARRSTR